MTGSLLLVDDEPNITNALQRELRKEGYTIFQANSAEQGLEVMAQHAVDVIISDQRMPITTGTEFLRQVRQTHPDTTRIVLSGYADFQAVVDAVNDSAIYQFWTKPWEQGFIREQVRAAFAFTQRKREQKQRVMQADFLTEHDPVTGLPNMAMFHHLINHSCVEAVDKKQSVAVAATRIQRFDVLQRKLPESVICSLLQTFADRLQRYLPANAKLACFGLDHFGIVYPCSRHALSGIEETRALLKTLADHLGKPLNCAGHQLSVQVQLGATIACLYQQPASSEQLMHLADKAVGLARENREPFHILSANR